MADSAWSLIRGTLDRYGLGALASWAWGKWKAGDSLEEIMLEMRNTGAYKDRFPAMAQLSSDGRAISEEAYISYEQGLRNLTSQFGLPMNLYGSRKYVASLLVNDISLSEAQSRMQLAQAASITSPIEYRREAARLYGVTPGQWTSMWLEPSRTLPELEKQFAAASIAGEATMATLGTLSRGMAERLVEAGITREQARQGLARTSAELTRRLPGESRSLGTDTVVAGALGVGPDADRFDALVRKRLASFAAGGSAYTTESGIGLGSTSR